MACMRRGSFGTVSSHGGVAKFGLRHVHSHNTILEDYGLVHYRGNSACVGVVHEWRQLEQRSNLSKNESREKPNSTQDLLPFMYVTLFFILVIPLLCCSGPKTFLLFEVLPIAPILILGCSSASKNRVVTCREEDPFLLSLLSSLYSIFIPSSRGSISLDPDVRAESPP
ncbi:hypothetical protein VNO77_21747 [Canavalia gladiata]|uniref:Uncharacterized protein n=1 Tax=Canavalia gladiata TaxID=3824 RepID=A0AAN9QA63_CANGL